MKSHRTVRIGVENRIRIARAADARGLSLSDAVRACAILGFGGMWEDVERANGEMGQKNSEYKEWLELKGLPPPPVPRTWRASDSNNVIGVRLPRVWNERLVGVTLKAAILAGIPKIERGVRR